MIPTPLKEPLFIEHQKIEQSSSQGWTIIHIQRESPLLSIRCLLGGGALGSSEGLCHLRDRTLLQLLEQNSTLPLLSGDIDISTSSRYTHLSYDGLGEELDKVVELFYLLLTEEPRFSSELASCRAQIIDELHANEDWPADLMHQIIRAQLTPELKWGVQGRRSTLIKLQAEDLDQSWKEGYQSPMGVIISVGPYPLSQLLFHIDQLPPAQPLKLPQLKIAPPRGRFYLPMELEQAQLLMVATAPPPIHPLFSAWKIGVEGLGGALDARLPLLLRVQAGLTYDLSLSLQEGSPQSLIFLSTSIEHFNKAYELLTKGLHASAKNWSSEELEQAKLRLHMDLINSTQTNSDLCDKLEQSWVSSQAFPAEFSGALPSCSRAQLDEAMKAFSLSKWLTVAIGPQEDLPTNFQSIDKPSSVD